jgi:hypothetical protein
MTSPMMKESQSRRQTRNSFQVHSISKIKNSLMSFDRLIQGMLHPERPSWRKKTTSIAISLKTYAKNVKIQTNRKNVKIKTFTVMKMSSQTVLSKRIKSKPSQRNRYIQEWRFSNLVAIQTALNYRIFSADRIKMNL